MLYEESENIPLVCWRGRWLSEKALVFYLQDALTRRSLANLNAHTKERLLLLERLYPSMIKRSSFAIIMLLDRAFKYRRRRS